MKLKRLTIHNIASIEDAEIDFDAKPLSDCEVFLITGRTGSGKTTVLDAICLALYNMAPRMKNSDMGGSVDDYDDRSLGVNDCRNFLRRATGKGFVRLVFVGNDSHEYEAEWTVRRSRDKSNGRLQSSQHILTDLTATESWRKENDIKAQIQRIVGLDFEQFCRTSMLAQGEFSRFLNSSDDQKSIILEKITGVKSFSRIGETIFNLSKEHQEKYNIILDRIKQIGILDKDAVARLHAERKDATDCLNAFRDRYDSAIKKREWLRECFRLRDKLAGFRTERAISDEYSILTGAVEQLRSRVKLRLERQSELKLKLDTYVPVKDVLDNSAGIIERIRRQTGLASQVADISGLVRKKEEALRINSEKHKEYIQAFDDACHVKNVTEKQLAEHEQELASKRLPELYDRRNALNVRKAEVDRLQERLDQLKAETAAFERDRAALKDKQAGLERLEKEIVGLQATEKVYAETEATLRKAYDIVRQQGEQWVESCRHKLQTGDMCPVCLRVIESSLPSDKEVYERNIYPVEKAHAEAECRLKEARRALDETSAARVVMRNEINRFETELNKRSDVLAENRFKVTSGLEKYGIGKLADATAALKEIQTECDARLDEMKHLLEEGVRLSNATENLRIKLKSDSAVTENTRKKVFDSAELLSQIKNGIDSDRRMAESIHQEINNIECFLKRTFADDYWGNMLDLDRNSMISLLTAKTAEYRHTADELSSVSREIELAELRIQSLDVKKNSIIQRCDKLSDVLPKTPQGEIADLDTSMQHLLDELIERDTWTEEYNRHLGKNPMSEEDCDLKQLQEKIGEIEEKRETLSRRIGAIDDELRQNERNMQQIEQLVAEAERYRRQQEKWDRLNLMFGSRDGKKFRVIAQSYVLGHLVDIANGYMRHLMPRYKLRVQPGTFVILVEDFYQGGELRPASSISGGETFVVSLALALALSDMSGKLSMDMLFIDEGFGTLSGDALRRAVDTLRSLHGSKHRRVGIISHVEELRECIDVQIQLRQENRNGASEICICG